MKDWTKEEKYSSYKSEEEVKPIFDEVSKSNYRQHFHIQPVTGLLNDPNGFIYHDGVWHLFYQWFPLGAIHGLKHWYHVTSTDIIHWKNEGLAIRPGADMDNKGAYSGSAFYYDKSIKIDTVKSLYMTYRCNSPGCDNCDAYQCERCVYKNINGTGEINTPTEIQCKVAHVERRYSIKLLERLKAKKIVGYEFTEILPVEYDDPVEALIQRNSPITHSLL